MLEADSETSRLGSFRRVVKLGGSLLRRADLPERLSVWLAAQPPGETLVIVGGGELIDAMRRLDAVRPVDPATMHWRCVRLLRGTFETVRDWFPSWHVIESAAAFEAAIERGFATDAPTLISVPAFYHPGSAADSPPLPEDWRTTTDAIAGRLAVQVRAARVVLLKSCPVDPSADISELSRRGVVDQAIAGIADRVPLIDVQPL
jgi:aspartokinase-like uncharacterized kinase